MLGQCMLVCVVLVQVRLVQYWYDLKQQFVIDQSSYGRLVKSKVDYNRLGICRMNYGSVGLYKIRQNRLGTLRQDLIVYARVVQSRLDNIGCVRYHRLLYARVFYVNVGQASLGLVGLVSVQYGRLGCYSGLVQGRIYQFMSDMKSYLQYWVRY